MTASPEAKSTDDFIAGAYGYAEAVRELFAPDAQPDRFLVQLLATQCRLGRAGAGAIVRLAEADKLQVLAIHPQRRDRDALNWIARAAIPLHKAIQKGQALIVPERDQPPSTREPRDYLDIIPLRNQGGVRAAAVYRLRALSPRKLMLRHARLETTAILLDHHELRLAMQRRNASVDRLRQVLEVLDGVNGAKRFLGAAMALCNEVATRLDCRRVSLGLLDGRCVKVRAMSHTDAFSRKMRAVQVIEAAMEECLDQDLEVIHPAEGTSEAVRRAAAKLAEHNGPASVLSLPLREDGRVQAVLTLERSPAKGFNHLAELETLRLIGDLCTPRLLDLHRNDRWLGGRLASGMRKQAARLLGPEHTWIKIGAALVFLLSVLLTTLKGDYRIHAGFTLQARHQQVVVAPFDTFSKEILVEPGDWVDGGQTRLATLETAELRLKLAALKAERLGYRKQMTAAMRDRNTAEAQMARALSDKVSAEILLIEKQIAQAALIAPISGWIVSEDLKQQIGAPVATGDILFKIAGLDALRAELHVPESSMASVMTDQTGELAVVGHPERKVAFVIERIHPIAEVIDHQNVFRVRARLREHLAWMRPGMEGEARIAAGKKSYLWIASHRLINWLRLKLWI